ncbi:MAG: type II toxin-antitoxin system HigB family toxin [Thiotrichales bacterium]|jgi:mRNA interferase HigB|nr:type II toxin-antitoxin system HigB family toxin [Thiotrichales bacterium]MBT3614042.1 type II toxin-antitoxin system HigB family toxin [Thiotrichales bacterium]MBT3753138.1 type II toxin-antitoxin system HigB family toxin [Thiotrichales bacterium]MBT3836927.1 type II toxin-antitoxin system HigB family toxin [Thiotrichales bacterium]MBT4261532.1 type II toxin-antitoxin system HigB family toxin [Thiotrichales bacterium]
MRIIAKKALRDFWKDYPDAQPSLEAWHAKVKKAKWETSNNVKADYRNASFVANNRVIFNIKGNKYRIVVAINYDFGIVYIRFVGSHKEYDNIDTTTI